MIAANHARRNWKEAAAKWSGAWKAMPAGDMGRPAAKCGGLRRS